MMCNCYCFMIGDEFGGIKIDKITTKDKKYQIYTLKHIFDEDFTTLQ